MSRRIVLIIAALLVAGLAVQAAGASSKHRTAPKASRSSHLLVGINDEADTLYGDPATAFATLKSLKVQVLRVNLYWGGTQWAVANSKPTDPTDPGDPAYDWSLYDRLVKYASLDNIQVVFSILFTPAWANGGKARTVAPTNPNDLQGVRGRGSRALQRLLDASVLAAEPDARDRQRAAPGREHVDGVERAEQPRLAHAAVQARRRRRGGSRAPTSTRRSATPSTAESTAS